MGLLIYISRCDKPPFSVEVAGFIKVSKPMVAGMVRSLESKGYLKRSGGSKAKKRFTLLLMESAKTLVEETTGEYLKSMAVLW